jgi:SSS family transporter
MCLILKGFSIKRTIIFIWVVVCLISPFAFGQNDIKEDLFKWSNYTELDRSVEGAFVGISGGALIVAGGMSEEGRNIDTISVLQEGASKWDHSFKLEKPIAFGSAVTVDGGMVIIGGRTGGTCLADVTLIKWDPAQKNIETESLPDLPSPCAYSSAAVIDKKIYVAGGVYSLESKAGEKNFWVLDWSVEGQMQWLPLESWPGGGRVSPVTAAQLSEEYDSFYIFGGCETMGGQVLTDGYRYDWLEKDEAKRWKKIADIGMDVTGMSGVKTGQSHILLFGSRKKSEVIVYHTITNTWITKSWGPERTSSKTLWWGNKIISIGDSGTRGEPHLVFGVKPEYTRDGFGSANYIVLGGYLCILVCIGYYFSKKTKSSNDFLLAGKRIPWWAAGTSILATAFSAISFMSTPGKVYATNWLYFMASIAGIPLMLVVIYVFIPFYRRLNITTAYEYLELRFNLWVRLFGSGVFILFQFGRMAVVLLLPAMALSALTGIGVQTCILTMGVFCIIYTIMGGIEAVIWNDFLQTVVLFGTAIWILIIVFTSIEGGVNTVITMGMADNKFQFVDWSWDYTVAALWIVIIGGSLTGVQGMISDQATIQRYMTTPDLKQAQKSLWLQIWILIPMNILFFMLGTAFYVYYKTNPGQLNPVIDTDAILPWFVVQKMPAGICGLMIAGIFAASMSSLDSSIHATMTAIMNDFYHRFKPGISDKSYFRLARWTTLIIGVIGTGLGLLLSVYNIPSLWDFFMKILGLLGGGVTGIFVLGVFSKRANGPGAFVGAIVSVVLVFAAQTYTHMHFFLYGAIGLVSAIVVGYLASLIIPTNKKDLTGLTIYTVEKG